VAAETSKAKIIVRPGPHLDKVEILSFLIEPFEDVFAVIPVVNGTRLPEIALAFERDQRFEPAGGYGGLIPQWLKYGPLNKYFLGQFEPDEYFAKMGRIYLLGCGECGDVGCWPLTARVITSPATVIWDSFEQPFRRERDYSRFGPFVFEAGQYREAVTVLWTDVSARMVEDADAER